MHFLFIVEPIPCKMFTVPSSQFGKATNRKSRCQTIRTPESSNQAHVVPDAPVRGADESSARFAQDAHLDSYQDDFSPITSDLYQDMASAISQADPHKSGFGR
jgi:hypothetical protein